MTPRFDITALEEIPNVGPATVGYLQTLGINSPRELIGRDPYVMYEDLCRISGKQFDPCLADVFISSVRFMEGAPPKKWWEYTEERKKNLCRR